MLLVDERKLESDLTYRLDYLCKFMGFEQSDIQLIHDSASLLAPLVPGLVDAVYEKLHCYNATWRHFLPRQHGFDGPIPEKMEQLDVSHPQIQFRKQHLRNYLVNLVTKPFDTKFAQYLDMVGKIHTDKAGSREIQVPLVQMNALMGFVSDAIIATICNLKLPREAEVKALRAFNKLLWLQNDLISRHYAT